MEFHDLENKAEKETPTSVSSPSYPTISLDLDKIPELKDADVGDNVTMTFKTCVTRLSKDDYGNTIGFDLESAKVEDISSSKEETPSESETKSESNAADNELSKLSDSKGGRYA